MSFVPFRGKKELEANSHEITRKKEDWLLHVRGGENNCGRVHAQHYGFTTKELDFIINYDIKYRMGAEAENEDE